MVDKTHDEQVERWARFCKENPGKWKSKLTPFLNSQIILARKFYLRLSQTENGKEKISKILRMKCL